MAASLPHHRVCARVCYSGLRRDAPVGHEALVPSVLWDLPTAL